MIIRGVILKAICIFAIFSFVSSLTAIPPFKKYLDVGNTKDDFRCKSDDVYDENTAITFFGDSRIDLVDNPFYGASSLDFYLQSDKSWNVQNFGVAGWPSTSVKDLLIKCLRTKPGTEVINHPPYCLTFCTQGDLDIYSDKLELEKG